MSAKNANFQLTITKAQVAIKSCPSWHTGYQWNHNDRLLHSCVPDTPTTQIFSIFCYLKRKHTKSRTFHHILLLIACYLCIPQGTFFQLEIFILQPVRIFYSSTTLPAPPYDGPL
ncbi:hypothetical protein ACM17_07080 [Escherichia coli]|nr:hypothetical protein RG54_24095 [Escherichia coli]APK97032.1 hypothetical protein RG55_00380 [Escherichia coli]APL35624.1 hypothetical protein RG62_23940 [Escherichia coli]EFC1623515.1 hypothetical protein [Escherichia coli]EFC1644387.1 hypothetical protein [Escherichia coli]